MYRFGKIQNNGKFRYSEFYFFPILKGKLIEKEIHVEKIYRIVQTQLSSVNTLFRSKYK